MPMQNLTDLIVLPQQLLSVCTLRCINIKLFCRANLVIRSVVCSLDLRDIKVVTKLGGTVDDSELVEGMIFDHKAAKTAGGPTRVENAKVALIQFCISPPKTDLENNVIISDYAQMDRCAQHPSVSPQRCCLEDAAAQSGDKAKQQWEALARSQPCLPQREPWLDHVFRLGFGSTIRQHFPGLTCSQACGFPASSADSIKGSHQWCPDWLHVALSAPWPANTVLVTAPVMQHSLCLSQGRSVLPTHECVLDRLHNERCGCPTGS